MISFPTQSSELRTDSCNAQNPTKEKWHKDFTQTLYQQDKYTNF